MPEAPLWPSMTDEQLEVTSVAARTTVGGLGFVYVVDRAGRLWCVCQQHQRGLDYDWRLMQRPTWSDLLREQKRIREETQKD